jgi:hypothetical protein
MDGASSASLWSEAHGDGLVEAALLTGASDWQWHRLTWGVVFEVALEDEASWERYLSIVSVRAALDVVPDPVSGLILYQGRGGSSGNAAPHRPRPLIGSGSAELPLPWVLDDEWREARIGPITIGERRSLLGAVDLLRSL